MVIKVSLATTNGTDCWVKMHLHIKFWLCQFGTQVKFRWSRDRNDRAAENAFSTPWFFSEMELKPAAG